MPNIGKDDHPKLWSLIFVLIIALTFCCFVMGQGLNSGTSVFLAGQGYGASLAGVLALVFSIAAALARLFVGPVIDNGKCSLVIIAGIAILIAGTALSAVVQGIPLFTISRLLQGVGFGAATTAASTAAASVLPQERLGEGIGYHGLGQAIAMSIGPAFALYLVGTDPSTNLYVGLALVGFAGLVIALNARYESKWQTLPSSSAYRIKMETRLELDSKDGQAPSPITVTTSETINSEKYPEGDQVSKRTLRDSFNIFEPRALPGAIPQMIMCPTFGFGVFFAGLYGTTLGYTHAGLFYTISAVSMIIIRMISKHFMDTVPAIKTMTGAVACGILCCLMLLAAPYGEPVFLASGIFYGLATGISLPLNQSVAVKNTPPERWGAANALFLLANDIGIGFASVIWGVINDSFGFQTSIVCVIVCLIASYASAWIVYPARDKRWRH